MEPELRTTQRTTSTEEPSPARDAKWVAAILGMSVQQVYALANDGTIPAFRPEGTRLVRFIENKVLAYREASRIIPPKKTLKSCETANTVLDCADDGGQFKVGAMRRG